MGADSQLIVVVEDDAGMRQALHRLLLASGYRVQSFDCAEALLAAGVPVGTGCLVLDIQLPGLSGTGLYAGLEHDRPPAVFITSRDGPSSRDAVARAGGVAMLPKPFAGAVLLEHIANAVRPGA